MPYPTINPMRLYEVRTQIKATQLINRLQDHVLLDVEMSSSQIRAATTLLNKCIPDLVRTEFVMPGDGDNSDLDSLSDAQLAAIARREAPMRPSRMAVTDAEQVTDGRTSRSDVERTAEGNEEAHNHAADGGSSVIESQESTIQSD
jgi:hypothetical protein